MILSRAPVRVTLGGGGTDLASYYTKKGGFLIAAAIDKYCTIVANRAFDDTIRLRYAEMEDITKLGDVRHPIFRAALEYTGIDREIELHSIADIPASCGLGTSSSFAVALLNALHTYKKDFITQRQLAEEACHVEIDLLGEPIGKQDQYMAAFGGLTCLTFDRSGEVSVEPLAVSPETLDRMESNLVLFYTGKQRSASAILAEQDTRCRQDDDAMVRNLDRVKEIGLATRKYLEAGNIDMLGELFHAHWEIKKQRSGNMSDPFINECYELARKNGAVGGKLIGAGGGGFLMFYSCNNDHAKPRLIDTMLKAGLRWDKFHYDFEGAKIVANT